MLLSGHFFLRYAAHEVVRRRQARHLAGSGAAILCEVGLDEVGQESCRC